MGEVLSNLYAVTGKGYYLEVAQRFDKKQFFDPLAAHRDELKGLHVNTHIPQVICRGTTLRIDRRAALPRHRPVLLGRSGQRALLLHRRNQQR